MSHLTNGKHSTQILGIGWNQGFKFRFGSHFGLDIETEYFVFQIVSVYHFGVHRIYIYIYIYFNIEYYIT